MAAVLASGPSALLSHRSAAALWDLLPTSKTLVDVTAVRSDTAGRTGIAIHRVKQLHPHDCALRDGIPVTSIARTLLDLATVALPRQLERAVEQAELLGRFDLGAVDALIARSPGRPGLALLREVLKAYREPALTRSELERRFLELCRRAKLPPPAINSFIAGFEVDAAWPSRRMVVELDGHEFHRTRAAFERDRARDAALQVAGYRVLRITYRRLQREPEAVIVQLRALLASMPAA
jgi:very-short-patch-repair endonuclease